MLKKYGKTNGKDNLKAVIVKKLANKHGIKPNQVYKILRGDRENEKVFEDYMTARELMVEAVKQLVPFN